MNWIFTFLVNALAVLLADLLVQDIHIAGIWSAFLAGAALGIVNTFVRPILILFTLPFTMITLGLFIFIINAATFTIASWLVPGFDVFSFKGAFFGALVTGVVSWLLNIVFRGGN